MPLRIIINDFYVHSKCCEIAYRFYNSGVMNESAVDFPWACLNSFTNIINADRMPLRIIINDFHVHSKCCEIAYRFYNSGVMNESAVDYIGE